MPIIQIFKSGYCRLIFTASFLSGLFLAPRTVFYQRYAYLALIFIFLFSVILTCVTRGIKDRVLIARNYKHSIWGIIASGLGIIALQMCGIGAPVCGAGIGLGIASFILPGTLLGLGYKYGLIILEISIAIQIVSLYLMKCFGVNK